MARLDGPHPPLIPAKAENQGPTRRSAPLWVPAFAGMSEIGLTIPRNFNTP